MKHLEISNKQEEPGSREEVMGTPVKLPYSTPVVQVYGSVSKLTMGSTGMLGDGTTAKRP